MTETPASAIIGTMHLFVFIVASVVLLLPAVTAAAQDFSCAPKSCPNMRNCAEAYYHYEQCGEAERDGDDDGIPCENVCGKTTAVMLQRLEAQGYTTGSAVASPLPQSFSCSPLKTCRQMLSCEEAYFQLRECGNRKLDRNGDGMPCNSLCRGR